MFGKNKTNVITLNGAVRYQTAESFGASACWWSQAVGGWTHKYEGEELRDVIMRLLYSDEGIGLTEYRYNVGAEVNFKNDLCHPWRSAESFLRPDGSYDFTRDANAVWALRRAVEIGVPRITFFCNSPPDTLTKNGKTYGNPKSSNLPPEHYAAFADYCFDIVEHFLADGVPVTSISPVNEPQWKWSEPKQEGCHYDTAELVALYKVFFEKKEQRPALKDVEIALPDGGEWANDTIEHVDALMADAYLRDKINSLDVHSYWTNARQKASFRRHANDKWPPLPLRNSEFCVMEHGKDLTMATALRLANCVYEDLSILNVVGWSWWLGVSDGDYKDGLLYVDRNGTMLERSKMFYALGNYSRFIKSGDVRVDCTVTIGKRFDKPTVKAVAYESTNRTVVVLLNEGKEVSVRLNGVPRSHTMHTFITDKDNDLMMTHEGAPHRHIKLTGESVTTLIFTAAHAEKEKSNGKI